MLAFGLAIFTGAFLLFLVQPLIAKFILPWFGGGPAVWTTCMLFFQVLLLGGYAYAHLSIRRLTPRRQVMVHLALLAVALALLPITPGDQWKPLDGSQPTWRILWLLLACLGLPYFAISATGPLFQAWFSESHPRVSPYRLYALSNVGSLLALVGYPFLVEPNVTRHAQAVTWSVGLGVFAVIAAWCGVVVWKRAGEKGRKGEREPDGNVPALSPAPSLPLSPASSSPFSPARARWLWFALPASASVLLLAVTNKICQDIAVIPFLWVLPLSLYLLSFIICFDSPRWYWRPFWLSMLALAYGAVLWVMLGNSLTTPSSSWFGDLARFVGGDEGTRLRPLVWLLNGCNSAWVRPVSWLIESGDSAGMFVEIGIYLAAMFVACMVCHGEVYRLRPEASRLTGFYLMISAGGAAGGLFVAVVAPVIFKNYFELHTGLFLVAALVAVVLFVDERSPLRRGRPAWAWGVVGAAFLGFGAGLWQEVDYSVRNATEISRNFYGVLKVNDYYPDEPERHKFMLQHGGTTHGLQFVAEAKRRLPTSYYTSSSGIGRTMTQFARRPRRVGIVGLGTGSMAVWSRTGDYFRFYEINDEVLRLARSRFWYLKDAAGKVDVILGDARLSLEREADQQFDVLVLDAFSSDAIPAHLLTREAFEIYQRHMAPDGVIAVHISNRYLNLQPIVLRLADHFGLDVAQIDDNDVDEREEDEESSGAYSSDWVLLTKNTEFLELKSIADATSTREEFSPRIKMWTDEKSDLFRILMF